MLHLHAAYKLDYKAIEKKKRIEIEIEMKIKNQREKEGRQ